MHFREVPLILHEIQFKTWRASHSPAFDLVPDISSIRTRAAVKEQRAS